jgi:hypothetical protein
LFSAVIFPILFECPRCSGRSRPIRKSRRAASVVLGPEVEDVRQIAKVDGAGGLASIVKTADCLSNVRACVADAHGDLFRLYRSEPAVFKASAFRAVAERISAVAVCCGRRIEGFLLPGRSIRRRGEPSRPPHRDGINDGSSPPNTPSWEVQCGPCSPSTYAAAVGLLRVPTSLRREVKAQPAA